ncbi:DUF4391 domain-containing protein [Chryseobacterium profundimaris]|uniref:DUF4391 domain-containing protein n=1 Tax=Chryseobacterium profundimaris TaxID=1387275 RepID=A0ABY1NTV7_9FLAO|nr:DUF4391 domain-containing protein [Chryseobacterium profundimaris]SMP18024.1 protein of unknown function [Chryseobacterium profundimaris]
MNWKEIFKLPENCSLNIPITKVSLKNQDGITISESKLLDGSNVQSIRIFGVVSKGNANIPEWLDATQSFVEVYFISVNLRGEVYEKNYKSVARLIHKLIPHHCVVISQSDDELVSHISLSTKNINKNDNRLRVISDELFSIVLSESQQEFLNALSFSRANTLNLKSFYDYYLQIIKNYNLIDLTKQFKIRNYERTEELLTINESVENYQTEINTHLKQLKSITQMSEKVRINSEIHDLKQKINELKAKIENGKD